MATNQPSAVTQRCPTCGSTDCSIAFENCPSGRWAAWHYPKWVICHYKSEPHIRDTHGPDFPCTRVQPWPIPSVSPSLSAGQGTPPTQEEWETEFTRWWNSIGAHLANHEKNRHDAMRQAHFGAFFDAWHRGFASAPVPDPALLPSVESLKEVAINILHWLDHMDQATFVMSDLREQLRYALADCGIEPERLSPTGERDA